MPRFVNTMGGKLLSKNMQHYAKDIKGLPLREQKFSQPHSWIGIKSEITTTKAPTPSTHTHTQLHTMPLLKLFYVHKGYTRK